ncbi:MAG: hypothetical protein BRD55_00995 [Bacteroidetes bacterium SW_9_63_38]|nr:MAG: hypothetical protein BRD55_00995 [Bacteroidetes bacterium SW_9_63_38]
MIQRRTLFLLAAGLGLLLLLNGCDSQSANNSSADNRFSLTVQVEDASGAPIEGARAGVRPCYRLGEGLDCGPGLRRSTQLSGTSDAEATRTASQHPTRSDPVFRPPYPNPMVTRATFEVAVPNPSLIRSTLHTLDGTVVDTVANTSVEQNRLYRFGLSPDGLSSGLYEQRSQIRVDGTVTARDTNYVALQREGPSRPPFGPAGTASLGETGPDDTVITKNRAHFPNPYALPTVKIRDETGVALGTLQVAASVQFVVEKDLHAEEVGFLRAVRIDTDAVTLTLP